MIKDDFFSSMSYDYGYEEGYQKGRTVRSRGGSLAGDLLHLAFTLLVSLCKLAWAIVRILIAFIKMVLLAGPRRQ